MLLSESNTLEIIENLKYIERMTLDEVDQEACAREWKKVEKEAEIQRENNLSNGSACNDKNHNGNLKKLNHLLDQAGAYSQFLLDEEAKFLQQDIFEAQTAEKSGEKRMRRDSRQKGKKAKLNSVDLKTQEVEDMSLARKKLAQASASLPGLSFKQPALMTGGELKPYQLEGVRWLINLFNNGLSGILADEMGLGKTIQVIGMLAVLRERKVSGPFLICAPLATLPNWIAEIKKWCPKMACVMYHGLKAEREKLREGIMHPSKAKNHKFPIVITSYETCINDRSHLQKYTWKYLVVDEGQRVKNKDCRLVRELKLLPSESRLLLSGTPIQNTLEELWSLLNFVNPAIFSDLSVFQSWFDFKNIGKDTTVDKIVNDEEQAKIVTRLHEILRPFLLRRLKRDVLENEMPPKKEILLYAGMTPIQRTYYSLLEAGCLRDVLVELGIEGASDMSQMNLVMNQRKVCQHPYLFGEPKNKKGEFVGEADPEVLIKASGKLALLDRLLKKLYVQGHRVLIFSQMTSMISILEDYLNYRGWKYYRIDGSTHVAERQESIEKFNKECDESFVFLLSTRAGGLGINLASADTVIIYDSDWNPHQDSQAQDRCHRIGQDNPVVVYRLLTTGSVEIDMMEKQMSKKKLERMAVAGGDFRKVGKRSRGALTSKALRELLADDISNLKQRAILSSDSHSKEICTNHTSTPAAEVEISEEELNLVLDRQLIFADDLVYLARGGKAPQGNKLLPKEGLMYDVVDTKVESILDNMDAKQGNN